MMIRNVVFFLFLATFPCREEIELSFYDETTENTVEVHNGNSATIKKAIIALNYNGRIILNGEIIIDESLTTPVDITFDVKKNGSFKITDSSVLSIGGPVKAGSYKIFNSPIIFLNGSLTLVKSEWFGKDDMAVNYALLSAGSIPVVMSDDITVRSAILMNSNQTLVFTDATIFPLKPMIGGAVIKNRNKMDANITVIGGTIDGSKALKTAYDAILFNEIENAVIHNVIAKKVHITASKDTGNFHLVNCTNSTIQNVQAHDTWKMGVKVDGGYCNTIRGGYFTGTHDSGIGAINSKNMHVTGVFVDNCGTSDASNITINLQDGIFENSISINATGKTNGNGLTVGHEGYPAFNSIIRNNLFINNATKGVWSQGSTNSNISIVDNIIIANGIGSKHPNSAGITIYYGTDKTVIRDNKIIGNIRGVNLTRTSKNTIVVDNMIVNNQLYGIDNDGLNTSIKSNYLANSNNIFNDVKAENISEERNKKTSMILGYDRPTKNPSWLSPKQMEVLNNFMNKH